MNAPNTRYRKAKYTKRCAVKNIQKEKNGIERNRNTRPNKIINRGFLKNNKAIKKIINNMSCGFIFRIYEKELTVYFSFLP